MILMVNMLKTWLESDGREDPLWLGDTYKSVFSILNHGEIPRLDYVSPPSYLTCSHFRYHTRPYLALFPSERRRARLPYLHHIATPIWRNRQPDPQKSKSKEQIRSLIPASVRESVPLPFDRGQFQSAIYLLGRSFCVLGGLEATIAPGYVVLPVDACTLSHRVRALISLPGFTASTYRNWGG